MSLWIVLAGLTVVVLAFTVWPLLRPRAARLRRGDYDAAVYLDQLHELERDRARSLIDDAQAAAARTEIERRLLAAGRAAADGGGAPAARPRPALALVLVVLVPLAALALYMDQGAPELPDQPFATRLPAGPAPDGIVAQAREALGAAQARAEAEPENAEAWFALGRLRLVAGDPEAALEALSRARRLADGPRADIASVQGEALVRAADGLVTPEARRAFEAALAADPADPRARYFLALGDHQAGLREDALAAWSALAKSAPARAPWLPTVVARIEETARDLGREPADYLPEASATAPRGPTQEEMAGARDLDPQARDEMIRGMVASLAERLEREPGDVEGWRMLGRSWEVLGDAAKAEAAYARALALEPDHPETLLRGGLASAQAGDTATAKARLQHLLTLIPADHEAHDKVREAIERLERAGG